MIDVDALTAEGDKLVRRYLTAGTDAVGGATKRLERRLEAATRAAVPGNLWKAWASDSYPTKGPARNPSGVVYVNGRDRTQGAIAFWTKPGAIRGRSEQYLAVPLPAAGPRGPARWLTPGEWERAHGIRLRFVYRKGRPSLLVADEAVLKGRSRLGDRASAGQRAAGRTATVPIFVLLPQVQFRNEVAIEPIIRDAEADLVSDFLARTSS
ncbi:MULTISPECIES: DUF6441 family protein [unclassified Sphingomonas]|uniref:DUF6441 family protein n=1 Tax=unclassified Sphingomonas TaxID=196159 RepID=UPI00226A930E|nr:MULTISPECIES: DUF6441 family protein [unclassified Sphingomonas]